MQKQIEQYPNVEEFIQENQSLFEESIIQKFFQKEYHRFLLKQAIEKNDKVAKSTLNELFMYFYFKYRLVSYIATLATRYSIYYDQQVNKYKERHQLILDKPTTDDESSTMKDLIPEQNSIETELLNQQDNILDQISDETLFRIVKELSDIQKEILTLIVIEGYTQKEIAQLLNTTPQNISKHKQQAIKKIRNELKKENWRQRDE